MFVVSKMSEYYDDSVGGETDIVPDSIRSFVRALHRYVRNKNVYDLHNCYENEFNKLTERYYKASSWPSADAIQDFVDNGIYYKPSQPEYYIVLHIYYICICVLHVDNFFYVCVTIYAFM